MLKILLGIIVFSATMVVANSNCRMWFTMLDKHIKIMPITRMGGQEYYCTEEGKSCHSTRNKRASTKIVDIAMKYFGNSRSEANAVAKCYKELAEFICIQQSLPAVVAINSKCAQWMKELEGKIAILPAHTSTEASVYCPTHGKSFWNSRNPSARDRIVKIAKKFLGVSDTDARYKVLKCYEDATDFVCIEEPSYENCEQLLAELEGQIKIIPHTYTDEEAFSYCRKLGKTFWKPPTSKDYDKYADIAMNQLAISAEDALTEVTKCYSFYSKFVCIDEKCEKWNSKLQGQIRIIPRTYGLEQEVFSYEKAATYCHGQEECLDPRKTETQKKIAVVAKKYLGISDHAAQMEVPKCYEDTNNYICIEKIQLTLETSTGDQIPATFICFVFVLILLLCYLLYYLSTLQPPLLPAHPVKIDKKKKRQ